MIQKNDLEEERYTPLTSGELDSWMDEDDRLQLELEKLKEFLGEEEEAPQPSRVPAPVDRTVDRELAALLRTEEQPQPEEQPRPEEQPQPEELPQTEAPKEQPKKSRSSRPSVGLIVLMLLEMAGIGGIAAWWMHWIG